MADQLRMCSLGGSHKHYNGGQATASNCPLYRSAAKGVGGSEGVPIEPPPSSGSPLGNDLIDLIGSEPIGELVATHSAPPESTKPSKGRFAEHRNLIKDHWMTKLSSLSPDEVMKIRDLMRDMYHAGNISEEPDDYDFDPTTDYWGSLNRQMLDGRELRYYAKAVQEASGAEVAELAMQQNPGMWKSQDEAEKDWRHFCKSWSSSYNHVEADESSLHMAIYGEGEDEHIAMAEAQYHTTQTWLRERGITELTIYRGLGWCEDAEDFERDIMSIPDFAMNGSPGTQVHGPPVASWTINPYVAEHFAYGESEPADHSVVLTSKVPASRVFALPGIGGFGSMMEEEVVVINGTYFDSRVDLL